MHMTTVRQTVNWPSKSHPQSHSQNGERKQISQTPSYLLCMAMWCSSGQWEVRGNLLRDFWERDFLCLTCRRRKVWPCPAFCLWVWEPLPCDKKTHQDSHLELRHHEDTGIMNVCLHLDFLWMMFINYKTYIFFTSEIRMSHTIACLILVVTDYTRMHLVIIPKGRTRQRKL